MKRLGSIICLIITATTLLMAGATADRAIAASNCSITTLNTPYLDGEGSVASLARVQCGTTVYHLDLEQRLQKLTGGSWVTIDTDSDACSSCSVAITYVAHACNGSTSTTYRAQARTRWPDATWQWSAWSTSGTATRACG